MPDRFRPAGEARMSVLCPAREPCARGACRHQARSSSPAPEGARCGRSGLTPATRRHQPAATRKPTTTVQPPARRPRPVTGPIQHAPLTAGFPLVQEQRLQVEVTWAFSQCTVTIVASRSTVTSPPSEPGATSPRGSSSALAARPQPAARPAGRSSVRATGPARPGCAAAPRYRPGRHRPGLKQCMSTPRRSSDDLVGGVRQPPSCLGHLADRHAAPYPHESIGIRSEKAHGSGECLARRLQLQSRSDLVPSLPT